MHASKATLPLYVKTVQFKYKTLAEINVEHDTEVCCTMHDEV